MLKTELDFRRKNEDRFMVHLKSELIKAEFQREEAYSIWKETRKDGDYLKFARRDETVRTLSKLRDDYERIINGGIA